MEKDESSKVRQLKKQIAKIKKENAQLKKRNFYLEGLLEEVELNAEDDYEEKSSLTCPKCSSITIVEFSVRSVHYHKCQSCNNKWQSNQ